MAWANVSLEHLGELPKRYRELLTPDEHRFFLAWLQMSFDLGGMADPKSLEKRLGFTPEQVRNYISQLSRKLNKTSAVDFIVEGLKDMGWWPLRKPSWWRPQQQRPKPE